MFDLISDLPFLSLFAKFMVASTVMMGAVWVFEKIRLINTPDLAELAWKLAIAGSFAALLPIGDWLSGPITIEHTRAAEIVQSFDDGRPLKGLAPKREAGKAFVPDNDIPMQAIKVDDTSAPALELRGSDGRTFRSATASSSTKTMAETATGHEISMPETDSPEGDSENYYTTSWIDAVADLSTKQLATLAWGFIAFAAIAMLGLAYRLAVKDLGSRTRVPAEHKANQTLREICAEVDIRHVPYLSRSSDIKSPICLPRREICLPNWAFDDLPHEELKSLLAHEVGHMLRRDPIMLMALQLLSRLFFFQPMFMLARRRLTDIAELAADEWAARQLADARAVATALFTCATKIQENRQIQWGLAMAGNKSMLKTRVERLIGAERLPFKNAGVFAKSGLTAGMVVLALGLPSIEFAEALNPETSLSDDWAMDMNEPEAPFKTNIAMREMGLSNVQGTLELDGDNFTFVSDDGKKRGHRKGDSRSVSISSRDDGHMTGNMVWTENGHTIKAEWDGNFELTADERYVAEVDDGGELELETKGKGPRRRVRFESEDGKIETTYWVDGDKTALDTEGQEWVAETLLTLIRETGLNAPQRVKRILKADGVKGVIKEIDELESDYVTRIYATHLMHEAKLSDKEQLKLVERLAQMESDYETRLALTTMMMEQNLSPKVMPVVLEAAKSIESDYELRLLLTPYFEKFGVNKKTMGVLIDLAKNMESDYEIRLLLTPFVVGSELDSDMMEDLLEVAERIESDYEQRLLLSSIIHEKKLSKKNIKSLAKIAKERIESDYELRLFIGSFVEQIKESEDATETLVETLHQIDSDYERRQAILMIASYGKMSSKSWREIIDATAAIDSDYEKAETLLALRYLMPEDNKDLNKALFSAIEGIDSKYERERVSALASGKYHPDTRRGRRGPSSAPRPAPTPAPAPTVEPAKVDGTNI
ncbi:M56 family metallopeptidase [Kordiimonas sp.]|uniref:M56 family metallopeptidase n=1 Tax=Kordiimonas sp. TaxID=1970157 RepID=UPI003A8E762A